MTSENVIFPRFSVRSASYTSGSIRIERPSPARGIITTLWLHNINISRRKGKNAFDFIFRAQTRQKLWRSRSLSKIKDGLGQQYQARNLCREQNPDEGECREIGVCKFWCIAVTAPDTEERRVVEGHTRCFKPDIARFDLPAQQSEFKLVLDNTMCGFAATDMLVLVPAAHMGKAPFLKSFECHRRRIMVPGKKVTALVGEPLPALESEGLVAQFKRTSMDKEHAAVCPFHGHRIE